MTFDPEIKNKCLISCSDILLGQWDRNELVPIFEDHPLVIKYLHIDRTLKLALAFIKKQTS